MDENKLVSVGEVRDCGTREEAPLSIFTDAVIDENAIKFDALGPIVLNMDGSMGRISNWSTMSDVEQKQAFRLIARRNKKRALELQEHRQQQQKSASYDSAATGVPIPRVNAAEVENIPGIRIVCVSDTHSKHWDLSPLPPGDVLLHAGDFCGTGSQEEVASFLLWMEGQDFTHKVFIAGNHDTALDAKYYARPGTGGAVRFGHVLDSGMSAADTSRQCLEMVHSLADKNTVYLQDSAIQLSFPGDCTDGGDGADGRKGDGGGGRVSVYGTPWQPEFCDWAFNLPPGGAELQEVWERIPAHCDVLLTHSPPRGLGDLSDEGVQCGCELLLQEVLARPPRLHVFGHVHEGYGE
jgi:hypothetical protein